MQLMRVFWLLTLCTACGAEGKSANVDAGADAMRDAALSGDGDPSCTPGTRGCECASGLCRTGLGCEANVCRSDTQSDAGDTRDGDSGASCGDTSADPSNCGACGRVCESGVCENGRCANTWSPCFTEGDGFTTCEEVCADQGATCVAAGCDQEATLRVWGGATKTRCELNVSPAGWDSSACDAALSWGSGSTYQRCCCTYGP